MTGLTMEPPVASPPASVEAVADRLALFGGAPGSALRADIDALLSDRAATAERVERLERQLREQITRADQQAEWAIREAEKSVASGAEVARLREALEGACEQILDSYRTWVADDIEAHPRPGQIPRYDAARAALTRPSQPRRRRMLSDMIHRDYEKPTPTSPGFRDGIEAAAKVASRIIGDAELHGSISTEGALRQEVLAAFAAIPTPDTLPTGWNSDMGEAPRDRTKLVLLTMHGSAVAAFYDPTFDGDLGAWVASNEGEHPVSWTDGICWGSNDQEMPSDPPVAWMHLPLPPPPPGE